MFGVGNDRLDLAPLDNEGNRTLDDYLTEDGEVIIEETLGCHVEQYVGLNVLNPQPGFIYSWANDDARSRLQTRQRGSQIVQAGDPELAAYQAITDGATGGSDLDSSHAGYPGVILVRTPEAVERKRRETEQRKRDSLLRGSDSFLDRETAQERELAQSAASGHGSLRYATRQHRMRATAGPNESDPTLDTWNPAAGITRDG